MFKGVYGKTYVDVERFIDMDGFKSIHAEICRDFVLAKEEVSFGYLSLYEPNKPFVNLDIYKDGLKPVWYYYDIFKNLPSDDPIRVAAEGIDNENDLILYIQYVYRAHNPYKIYQIIDREKNIESKYFASTRKWINDLDIFEKVRSAFFLIVEGGGTSIEHSDPEFPGDNTIHEFVHIRQQYQRPFYVKDIETEEKVYLNTRAACFNDLDYHGSDPCSHTTYALRIDGTYTPEFREFLKQTKA